MNRLYSTFLSVFLLTAFTANAQQPVSAEIAQQLQFTLDSAVKVMKLTGVSVNITMSDDKVWNAVSGYADASTQEPFNPEHLLWSGSIAKLFTGGVVLQLAEEGRLSLEDKIGSYFNDIPNVDPNVTLREMIKHRSGINEFLSQAASSQWYNNPDKVWTGREVLETYLPAKSFNHGTNFQYSNSNFVLLAMVVEQVTGNTLGEEMRNRFFIPLGLNNTFFMPEQQPTAAVTPCWSDFNQDGKWDDQANFILSTSFASMVSGAGAMLTQPADVSKYTRAVFGGELLSESTLAEMKQCTNVSFGPNSTGYGISTMRYKFFNREYFGHGGDISGFTTLTMHQPETNLTLTLMINMDLQNRVALAAALLKKVTLITTGIAESDAHLTLSLVNPANDQLTVFNPGTVAINAQVIGVDGRKVMDVILKPGKSTSDLTALKSGLYLLTDEHQHSIRFVKE
ncbi:MAG: serine hydrolase [Bacteroidota bacterium]